MFPKLLPFLDCSPYRFCTLRGVLYGKLARGFSQGISGHAIALRVLKDVGELLRLGYPCSLVRAIFHSLPLGCLPLERPSATSGSLLLSLVLERWATWHLGVFSLLWLWVPGFGLA